MLSLICIELAQLLDMYRRFHIELSLLPDFDALVKLRKPKNKNIERVQIEGKNIKVVQTEQPVTAKSGALIIKPKTVTLKSLKHQL